MTHPDGLVTALLGDGSYLMLNSELFSAAFAGHPRVAVLCDNGGYAVIHRLQAGQGAEGFNNLFSPRARNPVLTSPRTPRRWAAPSSTCRPMAPSTTCAPPMPRRGLAISGRRPAIVVCLTSPSTWTESGAWWEVGVPASLTGRARYDEAKRRQVRWTV